MKPWIKILIGVVSGFAGGFAAGFLFCKKLNDIQFVEIDEEEMAKIEEDLKKTVDENTKEARQEVIKKAVEEADPQNEDELRNALQGKVSYIRADQEAKQKFASAWSTVKDYSDEENANSMPVDIEEGFDEEFLETIEAETVEPGQVEPPHIISLSEFYNERPEYDKITIEWYEEDNVYVDENEEIIDDISSYIGMNRDKLFKENGPDDDPDIQFVRNEQYGSDYEIVRHHMSYKEATGLEEGE